MSGAKISLKQLMLLMVLVAIFAALCSLAYQGNTPALGIVISVLILPFMFLFFQSVFFLAAVVTKLKTAVSTIRNKD